jgi:hypothetical protein
MLLDLNQLDLASLSAIEARSLDATFTKEEIKNSIMGMPTDRAPGPDGFKGLFFKLCWEIIGDEDDMTEAFNHLHKGHFRNLQRFRLLVLILVPKKEYLLLVSTHLC